MIFRLIGVIMVTTTTGLALCVFTHMANLRVVAESEQSLADTQANISSLLRAKCSEQWEDVCLAMSLQYGPEWTNDLSGERLSRVMELARQARPDVPAPEE